MKGAVLWDPSAFLALLDADDANHTRAVNTATDLATRRRPCCMTNYIEAEAHALLLRKLGRTLARQWLLQPGVSIVRVLPREEERAKEILARHEDKDWSLCDAIAFAVVEGRALAAVFTFDHHFRQYGRFRVIGS